MCVIIGVPPNKTLPKDVLRNCYDHNGDGFGIMSAVDGKLVVVKSLGTFADFLMEWRQFPRNKPRAIHFRIKTHGEINEDNCHPFMAQDNLALMHNGIIDTEIFVPSMNDTFNFTEYELKPVLDAWKGAFDHQNFIRLMERLTDGSKLLFMRNDGNVKITFADKWTKSEACWFSNSWSLTKVYKSTTATTSGNKSVSNSYTDYDDCDPSWEGWDYLEGNNNGYLSRLKKETEALLEKSKNTIAMIGRSAGALKPPAMTPVTLPPLVKGKTTTIITDAAGNELLLENKNLQQNYSDILPYGKTVEQAEKDRQNAEAVFKKAEDEDAEALAEILSAGATPLVELRNGGYTDAEIAEEEAAQLTLEKAIKAVGKEADKERMQAANDAEAGEGVVGEASDEEEEEELTIMELLEMSPADICDWIQDSPKSATEMILVLAGRV